MAGLLALALLASLVAAPAAAASDLDVLAFTRTEGFRHDSIPSAVAALEELGSRHGFAVDTTEDRGAFTDSNLVRYDVVVFLLTTGDVLGRREERAFQRYVRARGGFVGVHSAADTEHGWPWYGGLVGAYFRSHPAVQQAVVRVAGSRRPWIRTDEWYAFDRNPRGTVRVLATLDESTYEPGESAMGADHPIAWSHVYEGGRAFYTGLGHTAESYSEPRFLTHLLGGIRWAANLEPPAIRSVTATVAGRRLTVGVRTARCRPCDGTLRVRLSGRVISVALRRGRAVTPRLPPGRWRYTVTVVDRPSGLRASTTRSVTV